MIKNLAPAMAAVSLLFVVVRVVVRFNIFGWDDALICTAWACGLAVSILNTLSTTSSHSKRRGEKADNSASGLVRSWTRYLDCCGPRH
jgi:hypothetical protein